eukprot:514375_1
MAKGKTKDYKPTVILVIFIILLCIILSLLDFDGIPLGSFINSITSPYNNYTLHHTLHSNTSYTYTTPTTSLLNKQIRIDDKSRNLTDCRLLLRRPRYKFKSFFHDWECVAPSFYQVKEIYNHNMSLCKNITYILQKEWNWKSRTWFRELFNIEYSNSTDIYERGCGSASRMTMSNRANIMTEFQEWLIKHFNLNNNLKIGYKNKEFYEKHGDILILNRHFRRQISDITLQEIYIGLKKIYSNTNHTVRIVYFYYLSIITQFHCILNSSIIITPHGSAETSFIAIPNSLQIKHNIKIIELCPPYTHCPMDCDGAGRNSAYLCPYYFSHQFHNHYWIGIGTEDIKMNCSQFCLKAKNYKWNLDKGFRNIIDFDSSFELIKEAIYNINIPINIDKQNRSITLINRIEMNNASWNFYNSDVKLINTNLHTGTYDLYPERKKK